MIKKLALSTLILTSFEPNKDEAKTIAPNANFFIMEYSFFCFTKFN